MTTTVKTILDRVAVILLDTDRIRWPISELIDYGNEGQLLLATKFSDAKTKTVPVQLVPGAKQTLPSDAILLLEVRRNTDGAAVTPCDRSALDRFAPGWMYKPSGGAVKHWMTDENPALFYVYPAQGEAPGEILLTYSAQPGVLNQNGLIDIRDIYAERLVNYILYRAFSKNAEYGGDANRALAYYQAALS